MTKELKYGRGYATVAFDEKHLLAELMPNPVEVGLTGVDEVKRSLAAPIGSEKLSVLAKGKKNVVIITSDITRPVPSYKILPSLLDELSEAGVADDCITVVFALGSHRGHTEEEKRHLVGDAVYDRVKCIDADGTDCIRMGVTKAGTPVDIFRKVAEADFKICVGNVEFHYFAGYSGGAKAIMPGVSTREAIQCNHRMMVQREACAGHLDGNPIREDIEEAGRLTGIDFICNVVLDAKKEIIKAVSGDAVKAHREGCAFLDTLYKAYIPKKADIVIVSAGGFPKDMNMYQAQKALDNAKHAVRDGGTVIWLAECTEGLGEHTFEEWMTGHEKSSDMIDHLHREFKLGGHKAAAIALVLQQAKVVLVSHFDDEFVRSVHLTPAHTAQEALDEALQTYGPDASIILMPIGGSTLPAVKAVEQ
ncbi:MAG: nickel-dependent lactate racemase [Ruminococcaceae bacterium]|nr:nickel-dependent lactate racemase [Oscillospiraceae bacterium]